MSTSRLLTGVLMAIGLEAGGTDVGYFGVIKSAQYAQTNDTVAPVVAATNAYLFTAFAVANTNGALTNATVIASTSTAVKALIPGTNGFSWRFEERFATQSALDNAYPAGTAFNPVNYTFTLSTTNDGIKTAAVNFFLLIIPVSPPGTPQLTNLASLRDVDTTRDITVSWNPLGGNAFSVVQLTVLDAASNLVWSTPAPFQSNALTASSTNAIIPAHSLPAGMSLAGHLTLANPAAPNTNSYPGAFGVAALAKDTEFPIVTRAAPANPILQAVSSGANEPVQVLLSGETNRLYQILSSEGWLSWTNRHSEYSASGKFTWVDADSTNRPYRFYRAKVGQ